jgi:hypothetical protein
VVNGEMSLRRLKLSIYEVVTPREEEEGYFMSVDKVLKYEAVLMRACGVVDV